MTATQFSRPMRIIAITVAAFIAASCTTLPTNQTAALKTLGATDQTIFSGMSDTEASEFQARQFQEIADRKKHLLQSPGCFAGDNSTDACTLVVADPGVTDVSKGLTLESHTRHVEKLLGGVASYASSMSDLAAAKDLGTASTAATGVAMSLKSLVTSINPAAGAAAAPIINAIVFVDEQLQLRKRRKLMLSLATNAQPVIAGAAEVLSQEATQLRGTLIDLRRKTYMSLVDQLNADETSKKLSASDRLKLLDNIEVAAVALSGASAMQTDFSSLSKSNQGVIDALSNEKADIATSVANAQTFLGIVQSIAAAATPAPATKKAT